MEPTLEEAHQPPASDERPKSTPELTPKPLRPGILKSPPGSAEPLKQASTKTLRFKMDESPEPVPPASLTAPAPPAPHTTSAPPASTSQMTAVPGEAVALRQTSVPVQHKRSNDRIGDSPEISPSLSEGTEETLSEGHSSSSSSSSSPSGDDWDVPVEHPAKNNAPSAATAAATAPAGHGLLGDHSVKLPSWIPDDMMRYFSSFSRKEGDEVQQEAGASRTALEIEDGDDEDDTSLSPPLEDASPWRTPLAQCAMVALLGGITLVLVVAAVAEASRNSVSQSVAKRELDSDDAITTVGPEESHDYMPVPQVPLNDIEESSRRAAATVRPSGNTEWDASFFHSHSVEDASALVAASETQVVPSTSGERPQEILGKVRQLKGHTIRPSRKAKEPSVCDPPSFTYCRATRPEFYYNHSSGDCEAASNQVQLCNRGPNRFPSKHSCHLKCVERKRADDLCSQVVSFGKCTRQDYKYVTRWYFDGKRCRRWRRSRDDRCLSDHDQVFTTAQDCRNLCIAVNASECHVPKLTDCGVPQWLSPYFAHRARQSDQFHCISVSSLRKNRDGQHVCLKGANRFQTVRACRETCARSKK